MERHNLTLEIFRKYAAIFENIKENAILKAELAEYGYDDAEIKRGKALYDTANEKLAQNKAETDEEKLAYVAFSSAFEELKKIYSVDRKKAKIIYKDNDEIRRILHIKGIASTRASALLEDIDKFYHTLHSVEEIKNPLKRLKIDDTHINQQLEKLEQVRASYLVYTKEKGESQDATKQKDAAFLALEKWVKEFYSIAKIALEDHPQLLESIAKFVRS